MAKTLLRSGCLDDFLALGENGQAVFDSALQIRETLRLRKQYAVADSLAVPQPNDEGDRVDWYSPVEGSVLSWAAASDDQRRKALRYLENCRDNVATLVQRCRQSEKTAIQLFGSLLSSALQFPGSQHVYLLDGRPVITFWGFVNLNEGARLDVLDLLRTAEVSEPPLNVIPDEPDDKPEPAPAVMSAPDEPPAPAPALETQAPATGLAEAALAPAPARPKPRRWLLPLASAVLVTLAAPLAYNALSAPETKTAAAGPTSPKPQAIKPAAVHELDAPAAASALPLAEAAVAVPAAPEPEAVPEQAPPAAAKNQLTLPAASLKRGSTTFLNGAWRVLIDVKDPITGRPPSLRYRIANNKGTARVVHGDNIVCKVEIFSGLHQSGTLMIKTRGSARCSDGSRYPMPEISCRPGEHEIAQCSGRYAGDTVVPLTFKKVSD